MNTQKSKELKKYLSIMDRVSDNFDIEYHLWDDEGISLEPKEPVKMFNMFRRTVMIFYDLLAKQGLLPEMQIKKAEHMAFENQKYVASAKVYADRLLPRCYDAYTEMYENILRSYGWEIPEEYIWNGLQDYEMLAPDSTIYEWLSELLTELYGDGSVEIDAWVWDYDPNNLNGWKFIDDLREKYQNPLLFTQDAIYEEEFDILTKDEKAELLEKIREMVEADYKLYLMDSYGSSFNIMAFHNEKLDKVHKIANMTSELGTVKNEKDLVVLDKEHLEILHMVKYVTDSISLLPIKIDTKIEGSQYIYIRAYQYQTNDMVHYDEVEPFMLAQPSMFVAIPILDEMMNNFISKWESR